MKLPDKILIYGLGMMGASVSLALQKSSPCTEITGIVRTREEVLDGEKKKSADKIITEQEFFAKDSFNNYGMILFALPVDIAVSKIDLIPGDYQGYVTDICSVKKNIIDHIEKKPGSKHKYISSHPMTGSEESGLLHANGDLYSNRLCILSIPANADAAAADFFRNFWKFLGMQLYEMNAADHDRIMAYVSHVPHILSSMMTLWAASSAEVQENTEKSAVPLTGGGFRDMVRIAGSNPEMWEAIITANKGEIITALKKFRNEADELLNVLEENKKEGFWKEYFKNSRIARNTILKKMES